MNLCNLKMFPENRIQVIVRTLADVLAPVIIKVLHIPEDKREQRLRQAAARQPCFVVRDGRPPEVLPIHQLLMTLVYLRHKVSHTGRRADVLL